MRYCYHLMRWTVFCSLFFFLNSCKFEKENNIPRTSHLFKYSNKKLYFFGDSYTAASGASSVDLGYSTLLAKMLNADEKNFGIGGSTLEKRIPINYQGTVNMVDRLNTVPQKDTTMSMAIIALGLNDIGQNGTDYTPQNYITDYHTVVNSFFAKGWKKSDLLLISPFYIGKAGYKTYAKISGNPAPTRSRHLEFITATKQVADFYEIKFLDIFQDQIKNDTTLFADGIHPNDTGYAFIANDIYRFLDK